MLYKWRTLLETSSTTEQSVPMRRACASVLTHNAHLVLLDPSTALGQCCHFTGINCHFYSGKTLGPLVDCTQSPSCQVLYCTPYFQKVHWSEATVRIGINNKRFLNKAQSTLRLSVGCWLSLEQELKIKPQPQLMSLSWSFITIRRNW